jgi:hypothetical protein
MMDVPHRGACARKRASPAAQGENVMTEVEWQTCVDPQPMLDHLRDRPDERTLILFICACCRRLWHALTDPARRSLVVAAEGRADGQPGALPRQAGNPRNVPGARMAFVCAAEAADTLHNADALAASRHAARLASEAAAFDVVDEFAHDLVARRSRWHAARRAEAAVQAQLLRCLAGNPFHPVEVNRAWLTADVRGLAQIIDEERTFEQLPILADALEDAGCADAALLAHLREPGAHGRGCFALDLLRKE